MAGSTEDLLKLAVSRGIISEAQHAELSALAAEGGGTAVRELPRGFKWVTVA